MRDIMFTIEYDRKMESEKWRNEIPFLKFPADWEIKIVPPFGGAVVRFVTCKGDKEVSVYMDGYENHGYFGQPHWGIYPDVNGDNYRVALQDVDGLLTAIAASLNAE